MRNDKTRKRSGVKAQKQSGIVGYRSTTPLKHKGFMEGEFVILMKNGTVYREYGYSRSAIIKGSEDQHAEDARLNATTKVLYREGWFVGRENYEHLDQEQVESVVLKSYAYYYLENEFASVKQENIGGRRYVVVRRSDGEVKTRSLYQDDKEVIKDFNEVNV